MRLRYLAGLTTLILLVWCASFAAGLAVTQTAAALLAIPYAALTVRAAWVHVRVR